jgi:hypothetical protein
MRRPRDNYKELITDGVDDGEATRQVLSQHLDGPADDSNDAVVVWVALAVTQPRLGRLDLAVAERAVQLIDAGGDLDRWAEEGPRKVAQRQSDLEKARAQLTGRQPARQTIRLPRLTSLAEFSCPRGARADGVATTCTPARNFAPAWSAH